MKETGLKKCDEEKEDDSENKKIIDIFFPLFWDTLIQPLVLGFI